MGIPALALSLKSARWRVVLVCLIVCLAITLQPVQAFAFSLVRDAETETTIRNYVTPIFKAAGLVPQNVHIYLVDDKAINSFVAGGQNIFINTGLLLHSKDYLEVIGVLAHETGHIVGGHLVRNQEALSTASTIGIISSIVGVAVGMLSGDSRATGTILAGGTSLATRNYMSFSRAQESQADQAALRLLEATHNSARGLAELLHTLEDQELVSPDSQDPYVRTHPLSQDRIDTVDAFLKHSKYANKPLDPVLQARFERIRAKVYAFSYPAGTVLNEYPMSDTTIPARYARAIAYYREPDFKKAIEGIDSLLKDMPDDPYFHELKAQVLFEHGDPVKAAADYRRAVDLEPESALLKVYLGQALIATEDPARLPDAERALEASLVKEPHSAFAWRQLAIAYGRQNKIGESSIALGEESLIQGRVPDAIHEAKKASGMFKTGTREWLHAQDILNAAEALRERK